MWAGVAEGIGFLRMNLSQAQLARKSCGLVKTQLNHYLAGRHKAGVRVLRRLEQAMELEPGTLEALRSQLPMEEVPDGHVA